MKRFHLQFADRGELRSFEIRTMVELDADTLADLMAQLVVELSKAYELKLADARVAAEIDKLSTDPDLPF